MSNSSPATAPPIVVMVGGGQLARMTHQAAIAFGHSLRVVAVSPDDPAAQVTPNVILGCHTDLDVLRRAAAGATVMTFDHEHVPTEVLHTLASEGVTIAPPPEALLHAQDKLIMRQRLAAIGAPIPRFSAVTTIDDVETFTSTIDGPVVIKTIRGGYDGRGVIFPDNLTDTRTIVAEYLAKQVPVMLEERVSLRRELASLVARSPFGQGAAWPVVQTVQSDGICVTVIAPAPELSDQRAREAEQWGLQLAHELGVVGVLAVELFDTVDGGLLVNELAMRPHNSGHWTMDGSVTSQFEQHLRAVLDYPLGDTRALAPVTVMANVLGAASPPAMGLDERLHHLGGRFPDARVHLYGKTERPGRKIGHVNILGTTDTSADVKQVRQRAELAAHWLSHGQWTDGWDSHGSA